MLPCSDKKLLLRRVFHLVLLGFLTATMTLAQDSPLTYPGKLNPHNGDDCLACHTTNGAPGKANFIKDVCITCHAAAAVDKQIHLHQNANPASERVSVPSDFPLTNETLDCLTCHTVACKPDRSNKNFLRGGPYKTGLDFCYQCHQIQDYQRINPHKQLLAGGEQDNATCLHCHIKIPTADDHPTISNAMHLDMTATCNKCHALHQHESNHQGRDLFHSKKAVAARFVATQARYQIKLPPSGDRKIQCNTCHNPHERGLLSGENVVYENPSEPNDHFLRLSKEKLCYGCHDL